MQKKKGISLIVLVITIIVMIILAGSIILTLSNSGIIDKANEAVEKTDIVQVKNLAALKWSEAYLRNEKDIGKYVLEGLQNEKINTDKYDITVTLNGVEVELKEEVPAEWTENVIAMKDGVPIPKGFVASPYSGERTKDGGLVIYELTEGETEIPSNETQYTSWTTRNQYVWVPVASKDFTTKFVRQNFGLDYIISNTLGISINYWEVILDLSTNMPLTEQDSDFVTSTTLAEVQAMYASVKEYGGFYIARYEAGIDTQRTLDNYKDKKGNITFASNVYSMMGKIPYTYIPWGKSMSNDTNGVVQIARSIYPVANTKYGVVSTLTYGVQWDTVLQWWLDTKAVASVTSSTEYGNHSDHVITSADNLNDGAKVAIYDVTNRGIGSYVAKEDINSYPKASGTKWALSTGALKAANVNNIYDMSGNMAEWTMEGLSSDLRVYHAASYSSSGNAGEFPIASSSGCYPGDSSISHLGFRPCLYIKQ